MQHAIYIHIEERLDPQQLHDIGDRLSHLPHVTDVEVTPREPHDLLVEYEPHENMPVAILSRLSDMGLHADVMSP